MKNKHRMQLLLASCLLLLAYFIFQSEFTCSRSPVRINIPSTAKEQSAFKEFGIGDSASLRGRSLVVHSFKISQGSILDVPSEGREYVIVYLTLENNGDVPLAYHSWDFEISDSQGQVIQAVIISETADSWLGSGEVGPGESVSGTLSFEVSAQDPQLMLHYHLNLFSPQEIISIRLH